MEKYSSNKITGLIEKIMQSKFVLRLKNNYPAAFQFLAKRLSLRRFYGLPLTILTVAIFFNLLLIADLTEDIINSKDSIAIDNLIAEKFYNIRSEFIAKLFYMITQLCNVYFIITAGILICAFLLLKKKYNFILGVVISLLGSGITVYLGKNVFEINRPHQFAYYTEKSFSFPSGHATIAVAFYGLLFYFLGRRSTSFKKWRRIVLIALLFCLFIGLTRLYLCVHYLSDVIVGYLLGSLWLLLSISIIEWQEHKKRI